MTGTTSIQPATTTRRPPPSEEGPSQSPAPLGPALAPAKSLLSVRNQFLFLALFVVFPIVLGVAILTSESFATEAPPLPEAMATKPKIYPTNQLKSTTPNWSALLNVIELCEAYKRSDEFDKEPTNYDLEYPCRFLDDVLLRKFP